MRAAFGILGLGVGLLILCGVLIKNSEKESEELRQKYENLKAMEEEFKKHLDVCDSAGLFYFKKNNINQTNQ